MRFTTFCASSIVAIFALTQTAGSSYVNQLEQEHPEITSSIALTQNEVVAGPPKKGKKKKDDKNDEEEVEAKEPLNWDTMSEADKQKAIQGLVIIAKEIVKQQKEKKKVLSIAKEGLHINESLLHLK